MFKKRHSTSSLGKAAAAPAQTQPYLGLLDAGRVPGTEIFAAKGKYLGCVPTQKLRSFADDALDCSQRLLAFCKNAQKVRLVITTAGVFVMHDETGAMIVQAPVKDSINFVGMKKSSRSTQPKVACFLKRGTPTLYDPEPHYGFVLEFKNEALLKQVNNAYSDMVQNQVRNELFQMKQAEERPAAAADTGDDSPYMDLPPVADAPRQPVRMVRRHSSTHL